jgi:hypothetical protein
MPFLGLLILSSDICRSVLSIELLDDLTELELDLSSDIFLVFVPSRTNVFDTNDFSSVLNGARFVGSPDVGDLGVRVPTFNCGLGLTPVTFCLVFITLW